MPGAITSDVALPGWLIEWMHPLQIAFAACVVLWLLMEWHRRAYNLTSVETAPARKQPSPEFLRPDPKKREAAIRRGEAYTPPSEGARPSRLAAVMSRSTVAVRCVTLLMALAGLTSAAFACLRTADESAFGASAPAQRLRVVFNEYWVLLCVAIVLLAVEVVRFVRVKPASSSAAAGSEGA